MGLSSRSCYGTLAQLGVDQSPEPAARRRRDGHGCAFVLVAHRVIDAARRTLAASRRHFSGDRPDREKGVLHTRAGLVVSAARTGEPPLELGRRRLVRPAAPAPVADRGLAHAELARHLSVTDLIAEADRHLAYDERRHTSTRARHPPASRRTSARAVHAVHFFSDYTCQNKRSRRDAAMADPVMRRDGASRAASTQPVMAVQRRSRV